MVAGPIGTYFMTVHSIFQGLSATGTLQEWKFTKGADSGNSTWAGATAAIVANIVLIAYVMVSIKDDQSEKLAIEEKIIKGQ